jgi:hypothetical protein
VHAAGLNAVRESTASQECEKRLPILGKKQRHPKTAPRNWGRLFLLTEQEATNERVPLATRQWHPHINR